MRVLDPGHKYALYNLDGYSEDNTREQVLTFVKRNNPPEKYPGNTDAYPGTTIQEVLRALIERLEYVDNQKENPINKQIIYLLRLAIWLLEVRAAEKKGLQLSTFTLSGIESYPTFKDGHIIK